MSVIHLQSEQDELPAKDTVLMGQNCVQADVCNPVELPNVFTGQDVQDVDP